MQKIHEYGGFRVDRNELSKLFYLIYNNPTFKNKELEIESGFGKNKIENLKYYLKNFNILNSKYEPSDLGNVVYRNDMYFEDEITLWVLFFHWANRSSNPFLYFHLNESYDSKTKEELKIDFNSWALRNNIKTEYDKKDFVGGLISRTLNAYIDSVAFKNLNIFTIKSEGYSRGIAYKMHPLLLAYVLYHERNKRTTITIDELLKEPNNIGKVFNLNRESLHQKIYELRDFGLVHYVQTANLHHIEFTSQDIPIKLLERYYEKN